MGDLQAQNFDPLACVHTDREGLLVQRQGRKKCGAATSHEGQHQHLVLCFELDALVSLRN